MEYDYCLPNDHIVFIDDASQGAVFNGKAITYDYTSSALKAVEKNNTGSHYELNVANLSLSRFLIGLKMNMFCSVTNKMALWKQKPIITTGTAREDIGNSYREQLQRAFSQNSLQPC